MPWMEFSIDATYEAADWVNTLLAMSHYAGSLNLSSRAKSAALNSTQADPATDWDLTIQLHFPYDRRAIAYAEDLQQQLSSLQRTGLIAAPTWTVIDEMPAAPAAFSYFVGQRFVILSANQPYELEAGKIPIQLGASFTFGSGLHPATIVSLRLLERYITPAMNVLDLGCGSGILSVAMAKLGAQVLAIDNDLTAVEATQAAVHQNGVEQQVIVRHGSLGHGSELGHWMNGSPIAAVPIIQPAGNFDLIVANLLARIHLSLVQDYQAALRQTNSSPVLITSGYTNDYEPDMVTALADANFELIESERLNEWIGHAHRVSPANHNKLHQEDHDVNH